MKHLELPPEQASFINAIEKATGKVMKLKINGEAMKRTDQQRKAIELYCKRVAEALDESGESVQTVFTMPVQITQENIKEHMFKVVQAALFPDMVDDNGNISTTDLDSDQVTQVYENMNRITAERYKVGIDFPSIESMYNESQRRFNKPPETARTGD